MKDILTRLDTFLYDFLGLVLPGAILLLMLLLPVLLFQDSGMLHTLTVWCAQQLETSQGGGWLSLLLLAYLLGHTIKLFSKWQYELAVNVWDDSVWAWWDQTSYNALLQKSAFFRDIIRRKRAVLTFRPHHCDPGIEPMKERVLEWLKENDPHLVVKDEWKIIYKLGKQLIDQEELPNNRYHYLSKYNMYRSLAFLGLVNVFIFGISWWPHLFGSQKIVGGGIIFLFWMTFHIKYKRYWALCGDEILSGWYAMILRKSTSKFEKKPKA